MRSKVSSTLTLDGSGNGVITMALPTARLMGIFIDVLTGSSFPYTLANMGRTIVAETATADKFVPIGELLRTATGTASTDYAPGAAIVHGNVTFTVAAGTAGGTLTVRFFYDD